MSSVFISYRREDSAGYAGRLHESLERRLGHGEVFRDADTIQPGQDFVDAITARLRHCQACMVLIGREWLDLKDVSGRRRLEQEHDYVRLEIAAALSRPDVIVIPVLVEGMAMLSAEDLPESIRGLSRRQAVSLRDETWDTDVDRLVAAVRNSTAPVASRSAAAGMQRDTSVPAAGGWMLKWGALAVALLVVILSIRHFQPATAPGDSPTAITSSTPAEPPADTAVSPAAAIAIPRLAEIEDGRVIYTILAGGVSRHGNSRTLRLRIRFSNEGRNPANFWDNSFRLVVRGQVLSPASNLNEVVDGYLLRQGIVAFEVSDPATDVLLRVLGKETAELPLSLTSTGSASQVDTTDTSDALSRAVLVHVVREARPLVTGTDLSYTLVSVTLRRFVNTLRVMATVRAANHSRVPFYFGTDAMRLLVDGQPTAPDRGPNEAMPAESTATADFVFDAPPSARQIVLRVQGESGADTPLDLPSTIR